MTYAEWQTQQHEKRSKLHRKLLSWGMVPDQVVSYFNFDNMSKYETDYCGLYETKTKCHDIPSLNCYNCGCPYFKVIDNPQPDLQGNKVESICTINSSYSKIFTVNGIIHCDCSGCTIPHTVKSAKTHLEKLEVSDTYSILELIRNFQLSDILGRLKVF